jgi:hypothetical protein
VELNLDPEATLGQLADAAPPPWSDLLHQHRKAFLALTSEITALAETNRDLLSAGQRAARETMMVISGSVETYGREGKTVNDNARRAHLVDEAI